ncbi:MAG: vanadium-dependent haloperoxidase [Acidobacteriota bacterium]
MRGHRNLIALLALGLTSLPQLPAHAQRDSERFSGSQKVGYLGQTSRSVMARNVLERLNSQTEARPASGPADRILLWHEIVLDSVAIDHTPDPDTGDVALDNGGPTRTSRALAIVQIAVFDAVNAIWPRYTAYSDFEAVPEGASLDAAIATASYTAQAALFPQQLDRLTALLESDMAEIAATPDELAGGIDVGERAALAILALRDDDESHHDEADWSEGGYVADGATTHYGTLVNDGSTETFAWEPDPLTPAASGESSLALGAYWGGVTPFSLESGDQYRIGPPPEPGSRDYVRGFREVLRLGASTDTTGSTSTAETRFVGNFWGYDGTPLLGTPPRLFNQIAIQVARDEGVGNVVEVARYLALINTGLADAAIAAWDSKYYYNYWRPVTAIRTSDGVGDTPEEASWKPVGISVINTEDAITPTPPFPAYPSGHSTFGASTFEIMRRLFGNDTRFTFVSDEYNGEGVDPLGVPRPLVPVRFRSLREAQEENGDSRIYNGVHWRWDDEGGQELGENVGRHLMVEGEAFQPLLRNRRRGGNGN